MLRETLLSSIVTELSAYHAVLVGITAFNIVIGLSLATFVVSRVSCILNFIERKVRDWWNK